MRNKDDLQSSQSQTNISKAVSPMDKPERFAAMQETGFMGARIFSGISIEELRTELQFPVSINTYKQMSYHASITSALRLYEYIAAQAVFRIVPPENPTEEEKQKAKILNEMMLDMEHDFLDVVLSALTFNVYGFSVLEKVYKRREDGVIAWRKLPIRNQEVFAGFLYDNEGNSIRGVKQYIPVSPVGSVQYVNRHGNAIVLAKEKVLLFTTGSTLDPYGRSPLRDAYLAWRYLSAIEELEASGVARDLAGLPIVRLPSQIMSPDASNDQKQTYLYWQNVVRNLHMGTQAGLVLPSNVDPETRQKLFDFELVSNESKKAYDTTKIKEYYKNLIFTSMFADILIMGQGSNGSYALASQKGSLTIKAVEAMLKKILSVLNRDLIRQTYELNGWTAGYGRYCKFDMDLGENIDLETYSKSVQRLLSTAGLPRSLEVVNRNLDMLGIDRLPETTTPEELANMLGESTSRSGDGFKTPFEGTATSNTGSELSDGNMENAA